MTSKKPKKKTPAKQLDREIGEALAKPSARTMPLSALPRDMREELFNLYATSVNPRATQRGFDALLAPVRMIEVGRIDVSGYPASQTAAYDPLKLPPVVIASGKLIDGGHRVAEAQRRGIRTLRAIDLTGILAPETTGFVADLR